MRTLLTLCQNVTKRMESKLTRKQQGIIYILIASFGNSMLSLLANIITLNHVPLT